MLKRAATARQVFSHPVHFLAFGFGSGLAPFAPGTFGTLAAIPLILLSTQISLQIYALAILLMAVAGVYLCGRSAKLLGQHDYGGIVWDEIVGFMIGLYGFAINPQNLLLGFILFRLFDIWKPWPIGWLDKKLNGGLGIMADDIVAGFFTWISLYAIHAFFNF